MFVQKYETKLGNVSLDTQIKKARIHVVFKVELLFSILNSQMGRVGIDRFGRILHHKQHMNQVLTILFQTNDVFVSGEWVQVLDAYRVQDQLHCALIKLVQHVHIEMVHVQLKVVV